MRWGPALWILNRSHQVHPAADKVAVGVVGVGEGEDIRVGNRLDKFLAAEDGNVPRARRAITAELDARIKSVAIHLDNPDWEPWLDDLEVLVPAPANAPASPAAPLW